ncbi:hypothetical protein Q8F55_002209 [Vanrija albida]|uniref:CENP-V/GFA domain-containing protein n=1 Tax=Vanrija albida TaxID=181172 RepID=A0ABR3QA57_9TREE
MAATSTELTGTCLCGAISVAVKGPLTMKMCHCMDCRKFTGTNAAYILPVARTDVRVTGSPKQFWTVSDNGKKYCRGFCAECGSSVIDESPHYEAVYWVHMGIFPAHTIPPPIEESFWVNAESWEILHPGVRVLERQEGQDDV